DEVLRRLDLDDVRAELGRDLSAVGDDVDAELAVLGDAGAARIGPNDDDEALALGLERDLAKVLVHAVAGARARVDRVPDADAAEAERVFDRAGQRADGLIHLGERVAV